MNFKMKQVLSEGEGDGGGGGGGTGDTSWVDSLPAVLRDAPFIGKATTPEAALQEIQNASAHMGNSLRLPGDDAGAEDMSAFYARMQAKVPGLMLSPDIDNAESVTSVLRSLGLPEAADGYKYTAPEGVNPPTDLAGMTALAHSVGLTQSQFQGLLSGLATQGKAEGDVYRSDMEADMGALKTEWGSAFEQNSTIVKNFLEKSQAPELIQNMVKEGELSSGEWKWLHGLAASTANVAELSKQPDEFRQEGQLTPVEAESQIQEMLNNAEHPYWNAGAMGHKAAIDKMIKLQSFRAGVAPPA
jgi:polyhydroxyalkanoate synthesis regulator phasin